MLLSTGIRFLDDTGIQGPTESIGADSYTDRLSMALPDELKRLKQYLLWCREPSDDAGKKDLKVPYYARGVKRYGTQGSAEDRAAMVSFAEALRVYDNNNGRYTGIGIAMFPEAGLVGVDLDDCMANGGIDTERAHLVEGTYTEVSPSGNGVRAFYLGTYGDRKTVEPKVEIFHATGFLTLTGNRMNGDGIIPLPAKVKARLDALFVGQKTKNTRSDQMSKVKSTDPVYQHLVAKNYILKEYSDGKVGITCPFADEHKSGSGESSTVYFMPHTNGYDHGTFDCKHLHCTGRTQGDFLKAIGLSPGQSVKSNSERDYGVDGELVESVQKTLNSEIAEETHPMCVEDFWAYLPRHTYYCTTTRDLWPGSSVSGALPPIQFGVDDKGNPKFIPAAQWLDKNRQAHQMTWDPGQPAIIENRIIHVDGYVSNVGYKIINRYLAPRIKPGNANDIDPWFNHLKKIYPDDYPHMLLWFAHRAQRPGEKINHAVVMGGAQGIGKDTVLEPVRYAVGTWNFTEISPVAMLGRFNPWVESVVLRVNEARDLGDIDRYSFYDHMKPYLAAPPTVLPVDQKNQHVYPALNCIGVIFTTNELTTGMYLPTDDRRHYVAWSESVKEEFSEDYWTDLWGWYAAGGIWNVTAYLRGLDISEFLPKASPPQTEAWHQIVMANRQTNQSELSDVLDALGNPKAITIQQIVEKARFMALTDLVNTLSDPTKGRVLPKRMAECDYLPLRNPYAKDGYFLISGRRRGVYVHRNLSVRDQHAAALKLVDGET